MAQGLITAKSIPESGWTCQNWITWYEALRKYYPKDLAQQVWSAGWNEQGSWSCKLDRDFIKYFEKQGIVLEERGTRIVSRVLETYETFIGGFTGLIKGIGRGMGTMGVLIPIFLLTGAGVVIYMVIKTARKTTPEDVKGAAMLAATRGRMRRLK